MESGQVKVTKREIIKKVTDAVIHIQWTIEDISTTVAQLPKGRKNLECNLVEFNRENMDPEHKFELFLYCPTEYRKNFELGFYHNNDGKSTVHGKCKFWLESPDGSKHRETDVKDYSPCSGSEAYFDTFFTSDDLANSDIIKNDCVVICGETRFQLKEQVQPKLDLELRQKLLSSYQQGLFNSITIQVEGKEIKVPNDIFAANSSVFERMLMTSNCKEVQQCVIEISDSTYEDMKTLIDYMHNGKTDNLTTICDDLFILAQKYAVTQLQDDCADEMIKTLNKENIFDRLKTAFVYNHPKLKEAVVEYVALPNSDLNFIKISLSDEWMDFASENKNLARKITRAVYSKLDFLSNDDQVPEKRQRLN